MNNSDFSRTSILIRMVRVQGGEWTPARVGRLYADHSVDAPKRTTHRADLKRLHDRGVLDRRDDVGRTYYVPSRKTKEGNR